MSTTSTSTSVQEARTAAIASLLAATEAKNKAQTTQQKRSASSKMSAATRKVRKAVTLIAATEGKNETRVLQAIRATVTGVINKNRTFSG